MKKIIIGAGLVGCLLALTGCATITNGRYQDVTVKTSPEGAKCALKNNKGSWSAEHTPMVVSVHRSMDDMHIICDKPGYKETTKVVRSETKKMLAGNLLFGGVIGGGVDAANGAAFSYPNLIDVDLAAVKR